MQLWCPGQFNEFWVQFIADSLQVFYVHQVEYTICGSLLVTSLFRVFWLFPQKQLIGTDSWTDFEREKGYLHCLSKYTKTHHQLTSLPSLFNHISPLQWGRRAKPSCAWPVLPCLPVTSRYDACHDLNFLSGYFLWQCFTDHYLFLQNSFSIYNRREGLK